MVSRMSLLERWKRRPLTPFGKVTVIKTLALPKVTHMLTSLPAPPNFHQKLEKIFFSFLWDGKPPKMSRKYAYRGMATLS